jgi:hypothetical protein
MDGIQIKNLKVDTVGDITEPIWAFAQDVQAAQREMERADSPYRRRAFVRALFAMIDGSIFLLKQAALTGGSRLGQDVLTLAEIAVLNETSYELNNKGEAYERPRYLKTPDNLKFAAKCLAKAFGCKIDLQKQPKKWQNFLSAIAIRNRITHPKKTDDYEISVQEVKLVRNVSYWFNQIVVDVTYCISNKSAVVPRHMPRKPNAT